MIGESQHERHDLEGSVHLAGGGKQRTPGRAELGDLPPAERALHPRGRRGAGSTASRATPSDGGFEMSGSEAVRVEFQVVGGEALDREVLGPALGHLPHRIAQRLVSQELRELLEKQILSTNRDETGKIAAQEVHLASPVVAQNREAALHGLQEDDAEAFVQRGGDIEV